MAKRRSGWFNKIPTLFIFTILIGFAIALAAHALRTPRATIEGFAFADTSRLCNDTYYFELPGFLTPEECDALRTAAQEQGMHDSKVGETDATLDTNVRMSTQTWFKHDANRVTKIIKEKAVQLVRNFEAQGCFANMCADASEKVSVEKNFEDIQVVRYQSQGKYDPHYDGEECGEDTDTKACLPNQRVATILIYLNDDFAGGETRFPNLNDLKVKPQKGKAVFFWVSDPEYGYVFENTLHGGDPVQQGEKWIATQWIRRSKEATSA